MSLVTTATPMRSKVAYNSHVLAQLEPLWQNSTILKRTDFCKGGDEALLIEAKYLLLTSPKLWLHNDMTIPSTLKGLEWLYVLWKKDKLGNYELLYVGSATRGDYKGKAKKWLANAVGFRLSEHWSILDHRLYIDPHDILVTIVPIFDVRLTKAAEMYMQIHLEPVWNRFGFGDITLGHQLPTMAQTLKLEEPWNLAYPPHGRYLATCEATTATDEEMCEYVLNRLGSSEADSYIQALSVALNRKRMSTVRRNKYITRMKCMQKLLQARG